MNEALNLLDQSAAPGIVGSYLDLAICRLEEIDGLNQNLSCAAAEAAQEFTRMGLDVGQMLAFDDC